MARAFNGSTQYLESTSFPNATIPLTLAAWFRSTSTSTIQRVASWSTADGLSVASSIILGFPSAGNVCSQAYVQSTSNAFGIAAGTFAANSWHHATAITVSGATRCYLDGAVGADVSHAITTFSDVTRFNVGRVPNVQYMSGRVCHVAVWSAALNAAEAAALAAGWSPLTIRRSALIAYYPLGGFDGDYDVDRVGGYNLTAVGSPTWVDQPRIIYTAGPMSVQAASGGGGGSGPVGVLGHVGIDVGVGIGFGG